MTESQTYTASVSGRTYFNIVLPAMQKRVDPLDLPAPLIVRAGRGAKARFTELTQGQGHALGEFCKNSGQAWLANDELSAASSILARVFVADGQRVHDELVRQQLADAEIRGGAQ